MAYARLHSQEYGFYLRELNNYSCNANGIKCIEHNFECLNRPLLSVLAGSFREDFNEAGHNSTFAGIRCRVSDHFYFVFSSWFTVHIRI